MSVRINLEIGHEASIRTKRTPEGFTHDWEVFVRGCEGAEIQYYVEKVVFYLHETFSKPRRVIKEPPYTVKESGYAGFNLPIEIYLRNKDEPKKIKFNYDLHLQQSGPAIIKVQKEKYVFNFPSEEFKHKLLKGGGVTVVASNSQENSESNRSSAEARNELINKPKLGGSDLTKKHKMKLDEPRVPNSFQDLFGTPITKTAKVFSESKPVSKDVNKTTGGKLEKDKDNKNKEKSKYSPAKERDKDRDKQKEKNDSDKKKDEKRSKDRSRERGHSKEMSSKREKSPKARSLSPKRSPKRIPSPKRPPSPPPIKHKEKEEKRTDSSKEKDKKDRSQDEKLEKKLKKEKRDKEHKENKHKDKDSQKPSEYKDHKKEPKPNKELVREKEPSPSLVKVERKDKPKEKESPKEVPKENKDVVEVLPEKIDKIKSDKLEEKQKHKHKKKDKEKKEKDKDKSHKERAKEKEKQTVVTKYPEIPKEVREDKANLFTCLKNEEKMKKALFSEGEMDSSNSSMSSKEDSFVESPEKVEQKKESLFEVKKPKTEFDKSKPKKDKSKKNKEKKGEKEEKKRKRKSDRMEEEPVEKIPKEDTPSIKAESSDSEQNSNTSQPVEVEKENQENPEDYMQILRDLQHKIMTLQDNSELQKVVQLIAETGRYEVSARTFDFDLCLLEKSTVRQLQEFFASSS